jgi:hypothetical protein
MVFTMPSAVAPYLRLARLVRPFVAAAAAIKILGWDIGSGHPRTWSAYAQRYAPKGFGTVSPWVGS